MSSYKKFMHGVTICEDVVMVITMIGILVLAFANVVGRFVFNKSLAFADELVVAVFVLISLVGAALACREEGGLVGLALLSDRLHGPTKKLQKIVVNIISIIYCAVLTYEGVVRTMVDYTGGVHTFVLHWPRWIFWAFIPVSGVCLILHFIENTILFLEDYKEGKYS